MEKGMYRRNVLKTGAAGLFSGAVLNSAIAKTLASPGREVRLGFIGVGLRGQALIRCLLAIPGWKAVAVCDINEANLAKTIQMIGSNQGDKPEGYSKGPYDYRRMLSRDDFDAVFIATPAQLHAEMSIDSMLAGKHVGVEVPAAYTQDECWKLVNIKEKTGLHYMLFENYTYMRANMMIMNMVRENVFGKTYFAECSYIHDCSGLRYDKKGNLTWRGELKRDGFGNLYPTHAIGPVAKWLDINKGDAFKRLTSYMSKPVALHEYAVNRFGKNSAAAEIDFLAGDMCTTQIQTQNGSLINVQYDTDSKRPGNCYYLVQGTEGIYDSRKGIYLRTEGKDDSVKEIHRGGHARWSPTSKYYPEHDHPDWKREGDIARKTGHGGGDYFIMKEFVESLLQDREPWIDIYDAVSWSAIAELSQQSIRNGNAPLDFPDFTKGAWKNRTV